MNSLASAIPMPHFTLLLTDLRCPIQIIVFSGCDSTIFMGTLFLNYNFVARY